MSKYVKTKIRFNKTQIKDGWVVILRKDGTVKSKVQPYPAVKE